MAYEFVCESEAKCYRSNCSDVLKKTCELLKEEGISAQFSLVGSGARNMITRNGEGPYDLDYNLLVMKANAIFASLQYTMLNVVWTATAYRVLSIDAINSLSWIGG